MRFFRRLAKRYCPKTFVGSLKDDWINGFLFSATGKTNQYTESGKDTSPWGQGYIVGKKYLNLKEKATNE